MTSPCSCAQDCGCKARTIEELELGPVRREADRLIAELEAEVWEAHRQQEIYTEDAQIEIVLLQHV